jgi:hypothetical protein
MHFCASEPATKKIYNKSAEVAACRSMLGGDASRSMRISYKNCISRFDAQHQILWEAFYANWIYILLDYYFNID